MAKLSKLPQNLDSVRTAANGCRPASSGCRLSVKTDGTVRNRQLAWMPSVLQDASNTQAADPLYGLCSGVGVQ